MKPPAPDEMTNVPTFISAAELVVASLSLFFLIKYVRATEEIKRSSLAQTEALSKPAVTVGFAYEGSIRSIQLINIGSGPAIDLRWTATEASCGWQQVPYIAEKTSRTISVGWSDWQNARSYDPATGRTTTHLSPEETAHTIICRYRSLGGIEYESRTRLDYFNGPTETIFDSHSPHISQRQTEATGVQNVDSPSPPVSNVVPLEPELRTLILQEAIRRQPHPIGNFDELKRTLGKSASDDEWRLAVEALLEDGFVEVQQAIRTGYDQYLREFINLRPTNSGRQAGQRLRIE